MTKVSVLIENLMDYLDSCENGQLYPKLAEDDTVIRVNINAVSAEFIIGKRHSPYTITNKSKGEFNGHSKAN